MMLVHFARRAIAEASHDAELHGLRLAAEFEFRLVGDVINATGVLLHTNLGRAPRPRRGARGNSFRASNVEFDLALGRRSSRHTAISEVLRVLIGAEASIVVNNNAAAVLLVASALARGKGIAVSRGESVEIGGGFRIPDVVEQSGARLVDVGTTNKTYKSDYERAILEHDVALIMKIHTSNFEMSGFVHQPAIKDLAALDRPLVVDIGSGLLDNTCPWLSRSEVIVPRWLTNEPAARQAIDDGAALVVFSGDKLLGGPQCGVIAGDANLVEACKAHPLMRAVRPGSDVLIDLQSTLLAYAGRDAVKSIPFWSMVAESPKTLEARATAVVKAAAKGSVREVVSLPGAGSAPSASLPSFAVVVDGDHAEVLRQYSPPVIVRVEEGQTICDLRSVAQQDDAVLACALRESVN